MHVRVVLLRTIVMKACSTLVADLAEVSRKGMESESANSFAVVVSTCFLETRSLLLPTSSLLTPSDAYLTANGHTDAFNAR